MKRLGKILHLSKSRSLIVKLDEPAFVKLGTRVLDSKLREIGKVTDLLGSVSSPYVSVTPTVPKPEKLAGRTTYTPDI